MNERAIQIDPIEPSATGQPEPTATYTVQATCSNCDWVGDAQMFKGTPWEKGKSTDRVSCPECGCKTLVRVKPQPETIAASTPAPHVRELEQRRMLEELQQQQDAYARQLIGQPYRSHGVARPATSGGMWVNNNNNAYPQNGPIQAVSRPGVAIAPTDNTKSSDRSLAAIMPIPQFRAVD